jgi:hypothetical protein
MRNPSLNDLADMIISQVQSGLKSVTNHGLSKSQVKDEIVLCRARMLPEALAAGLINAQQLYQDFLIEKFYQHEESKVSNRKAIYGDIPEVMEIESISPVEYLGSTDGYEGFKVVTGKQNQFISHDRYSKHEPTGWIKNKRVIIYNDNPKRLLLRAIFSNPRDLATYNKTYSDDSSFAVCNALSDMIVGKLVNDYMRYYRMANPQPNNQIEINQAPNQ